MSLIACVKHRKTNDAFVKTSHRWKELRVDSPKLIFSVITVDEESQLADVFGIESIPALVYLPESHLVEAVSIYSIGEA